MTRGAVGETARPARSRLGLNLGFVAALLIAACGGGSKSPPAAAPMSPSAPAEEREFKEAPPPNATPAAVPPAASGASESAMRAPMQERAVRIRQARGTLDRAQLELDVAAGDCRAACSALASMDRAAGHLCALAEGADERTACADAKAKVRAARAKVRATCGECAGGTSTDPNAPIPSAP